MNEFEEKKSCQIYIFVCLILAKNHTGSIKCEK